MKKPYYKQWYNKKPLLIWFSVQIGLAMSRPVRGCPVTSRAHQIERGRQMEGFDIYKDVAERTEGDIYIGVVGPVRTGKSTLVKKFMEMLVIPNIPNPYDRQRAIDEMPQSGAGRTVMTTEPKFVPAEAVEISLSEGVQCRIRLVDSVGYPVEGALGYNEEFGPRMVTTPWFAYDIPFEEAAEVGTRKVIADHSTIGLVVTTDGSFGEIPRDNYIDVERRTIEEIRDLGKPFLVLLNTARPHDPATRNLAHAMEEEYGVTVIPINIARRASLPYWNRSFTNSL